MTPGMRMLGIHVQDRATERKWLSVCSAEQAGGVAACPRLRKQQPPSVDGALHNFVYALTAYPGDPRPLGSDHAAKTQRAEPA